MQGYCVAESERREKFAVMLNKILPRPLTVSKKGDPHADVFLHNLLYGEIKKNEPGATNRDPYPEVISKMLRTIFLLFY